MLSTATKAAAGVTKGLAENDVRNTVRDAEHRAADVANHVADYASEAGAKVRGLVNRTVDDVSHVSRNVESEIKTNPMRSSLVALGAGFIIGALLTRR